MQSLAQQYGVNSTPSTVAPPSSEYMFHTFDIKPPRPIMSHAKTTDVKATSSNTSSASTTTSVTTAQEQVSEK